MPLGLLVLELKVCSGRAAKNETTLMRQASIFGLVQTVLWIVSVPVWLLALSMALMIEMIELPWVQPAFATVLLISNWLLICWRFRSPGRSAMSIEV